MPTGSKKPSVFRKPKERLRLEWYRLKTRLRDVLRLVTKPSRLDRRITSLCCSPVELTTNFPLKAVGPTQCYSNGRRSYMKPWNCTARCILRLRSTCNHVGLIGIQKRSILIPNCACRGDSHKLSRICAEGLLSSFRSRIASRPRNQRLRWTLHKHNHRARIVVNRALRLQVNNSAVRQVVIRLDTRQSLAKVKAGSNGQFDTIVAGTGEEKDVREYLVLQKRMLRDVEGKWVIWGTADETDVKDVLEGS